MTWPTFPERVAEERTRREAEAAMRRYELSLVPEPFIEPEGTAHDSLDAIAERDFEIDHGSRPDDVPEWKEADL